MAKKVKITETVLRDGHQSLCATRMHYYQMEPMLAALDKIGYNSLEAWGGATFDTCLRFLDEDPWERLDKLKARLKTPIQMLLRGQNLLGYNHYSDDVVKKFVEKASEHGMGVFRIFDALNDVRNLKTAINAALGCKEKPHVQGCLVYTLSPYHTNEVFVDLSKKLQEMGCHSVCIKDMSGLLKPYVAEDLVKKLKAALDIPIQLHTHYTSGFGSMTYMKAIEAGVDTVDCALSPFALDTSQPCTETMVAALEGTPYDTGLDRQAMTPIAKHFLQVKQDLIKEFNLKGYFDVKDLARGKFGKPPVEVSHEYLTKTLGIPESEIITDIVAEDAKAPKLADFEKEMKAKGFLNPTEEDILSYALFPQVAEEFFKKHYAPMNAYDMSHKA